jgi:FkbH-like protein
MTETKGEERETATERAMRLFNAQAVLFAPRVSRLKLSELHLTSNGPRQLRINVWRNHAIEPFQSLMTPYFSYQGWQVDFNLGGYDDTLNFSEYKDADAELIWIDSDRSLVHIAFSEWLQWLQVRLEALRSVSNAPIILATWCQNDAQIEALHSVAKQIPAVFFADLGKACEDENTPLLDARSVSLAGTSVGKSAQVVLARKLGCHWLPATLSPPIKAVILDLDETLHRGVLAEDGLAGLELTPEHATFQRHLKSLQQRGVFLALVSRNELTDVKELFSQRSDYPLCWNDFSAIEISWDEKATAIRRVAKSLRIDPNSMLFVDDNPGEVTNVLMSIPEIHTVLSSPDASITARAVDFYPAIWRWKVGSEDVKRFKDLKASAKREDLARMSNTQDEYFRGLKVSLLYRHNPLDQAQRLADLCGKTNQFNLALQRSSAVQLLDRMNQKNSCVTSVQLSDRFAESGVIAVVIATRNGDQLLVEELCISCRALGRQLESTIAFLAISTMPIFAKCSEVTFQVQQGPRNGPAREWLARVLNEKEILIPGRYSVSEQCFSTFVPIDSISVEVS